MTQKGLIAGSLCAAVMLAGSVLFAAPAAAAAGMPKYTHIFVIIEENHTTDEIIGNPSAPTFNRLAKEFGFASNYYAIRHPSEPNYVALVGGDTFGISDDDAYYCSSGAKKWGCEKSDRPGYVDHTVKGESLADQITAQHLTWKGYFEDIPAPGSPVYRGSASRNTDGAALLYAVKHNGFMTFKNVQDDPARAQKIVGFDALERDIKAGTLPNFAHIVPNLCNDMHGARGEGVPEDCTGKQSAGLIGRADRTVGRIVTEIMHSRSWAGPENNAIVITFDENDDDQASSHPNGCCGFDPNDPSNPGGGWIPTIVITNHGPRHLTDPTPYNHYSLLRTIEEAFGIHDYLRHAGDSAKGVVPMVPLFAVAGKQARTRAISE